jgi:phenylacetate-CoA ligase
LIVNGVNLYPSQIESALMAIPEVGANYQICIEKRGALDRLTVKTEINSRLFSGDVRHVEDLRTRIRERLKAAIVVNPVIELHEPGGLPVYEGKAKRVFDTRPAE